MDLSFWRCVDFQLYVLESELFDFIQEAITEAWAISSSMAGQSAADQ